MKILYIAKVVSLVVALITVFAVIRGVNEGHINRFFGALGADTKVTGASAAGSAVGQTVQQTVRIATDEEPAALNEARTEKFTLCPTRVHALKWSDGRKIEEFKQGMKMKWMAHEPATRELGYLEVEKWLGEYCKVRVQPIAVEAAGRLKFEPFMTIEFINGQTKTIARAGDVFQINSGTAVFRSEELSRAFDELRRVASFE